MKILGIETSCDETAISIAEAEGGIENAFFRVLANVVHSQIEEHKAYGGVYPSVAKREHGRNLIPVLHEALELSFGNPKLQETSNKQIPNTKLKKLKTIFEREHELFNQFAKAVRRENPGIDAIAVTHGPGLEPALWVGVNFAKALAYTWNVPLVPVNHLEGHIFSAFMQSREENHKSQATNSKQIQSTKFKIQNTQFPAVALSVAGGHTNLTLVKDWLQYETIGNTRDDAAGEAFDKVARLLGLDYPGGPAISKRALKWKTQNTSTKSQTNSKFQIQSSKIKFPRPMIDSDNYDFSFSGLKTAVLYLIKELGELSERQKAEIAYEFQEAVVEVLVSKTLRAAEEYGAKAIVLGGGVSANARLREELAQQVQEKLPHTTLHIPPATYTTDNAAMIAIAGYYRYLSNGTAAPETIRARGNLSL